MNLIKRKGEKRVRINLSVSHYFKKQFLIDLGTKYAKYVNFSSKRYNIYINFKRKPALYSVLFSKNLFRSLRTSVSVIFK